MKVRVLYRPGVGSAHAFTVAAFRSPFSITPLPVGRVPVGWGDMLHSQERIEFCLIKRCICIRQLMSVDGGDHIAR